MGECCKLPQRARGARCLEGTKLQPDNQHENTNVTQHTTHHMTQEQLQLINASDYWTNGL